MYYRVIALEIVDVFKDCKYTRVLDLLEERLVKDDFLEKFFSIEKDIHVCDITKYIENTQCIKIIKSIQ